MGKISTLHYVDNEDLIDVVAAVSGSGPAYLFAFLDGLVQVTMPFSIITYIIKFYNYCQ